MWRVIRYERHVFTKTGDPDRCLYCLFPRDDHAFTGSRLFLVILVNGPLRRLTVAAETESELPAAARNWLHTLFNIAEAAGTRIEGWVAYDGRGQL